MRSRQSLAVAARSTAFILALAAPFLVARVVNGTPCCDGSAPKDLGTKCGAGSTCNADCTNTAVVQQENYDCSGTGTASQYCGTNPTGLCTGTFYCVINAQGGCDTTLPVKNPDGTPVQSTAAQGQLMSCMECG